MTNKLIQYGKASLIALPLILTMQSTQANEQSHDLLDVWQLAQQHDLKLAMAHTDIQLQEEKHQQARAAMLPSIAAKATLSHVDNSAIGVENFGQSYSLNLKQGLYHRDVILQAQQVDMLIDNSQLGYQIASQQLQILVAKAYFEQLMAQDNLTQIQQAKQATANRLAEITARYEVGMGNQVTVQEAQSRLDLIQAQLIAGQGQLSSSQRTIEQITHQAVKPLVGLITTSNADNLTVIPQQHLTSWQQQAQANSLALQQLHKQIQLADLNVQTQRAAKTPGVDLIAQYSVTDNSIAAYGANADQFMLGIQIAMPLYTGGYVESKINEAMLQQRQLQRKMQQSRRELDTQVHTSYTNVTSAKQLVKAQQQLLTSAQLAFAAMETAVQVGSHTRVDLLDAERQYYSAMQHLNNAKYQYILAQLQLRLVSGSLTIEDLEKVNNLLI